jgi:hypothetical protein
MLMPFETPMPLRPGPPALWVLAGGGAGWRGADLRLLSAGLESGLGRVGALLPWGHLAAPVGTGPETLWDEAAELRLVAAPGLPALESREPMDVLAGANLLLVGEELLQFREVAPAGEGTVALRGLLRGRFGTRAVGHDVGTMVRLVRGDGFAAVPITSDSIGRTLDLLAIGAGDPPGGVMATHVVEGRGVGPMPPAHVRVARALDGALSTRWVPRGREAQDWGGAEPAATGFRWHFEAGDGQQWVLSTSQTWLDLGVTAQVAGWGGLLPAGGVRVEAVGEGLVWGRTSAVVAVPAPV